jgi:hypothetical protein
MEHTDIDLNDILMLSFVLTLLATQGVRWLRRRTYEA